MERLGTLYFKFASKLATIFYDEIITDSVEMNKVYKVKFQKESKVIAYGPTMNHNKNSKILEKFNLEKEYYLIVGRLIPDNNSKQILEGFKINTKKLIVVVGDVPYNDDYAENIKLFSSKVVFTGYINDQLI